MVFGMEKHRMSGDGDLQPTSVFQLVLSIFKGANLVVKHASGTQLKIVTKVGDAVKTSPNYLLTSTKSDPDFNYQIAWKLSKKELQDLRLSRGVVKIELFEVGLQARTENLIGYCTVSVKDAIEIASYDEIDVKSSVSIPLKGTKSPWKQYGPQLFYILHIEDSDKPIEPMRARKRVPPSATRKSQQLIKKSIPPQKSPPPFTIDESMDSEPFKWAINDAMGCFLLGEEGPKDDLYIMSIVTVGVRRFETLIDPSENPAAKKWIIESHCFGVPFEGDEFILETNQNEPNHLTYLGDRCTARVRASPEEFSRFLGNFVLEMKVMGVQSNSTRMPLGRSYIPLDSLCNPGVLEIRENFEVLREDGKVATTHAEIYMIVELKRSPECFKRAVRIEEIGGVGTTLTQSKENLVQLCGSREDLPATVPKPEPTSPKRAQNLVDEPLLKNFSECLNLGPPSSAGNGNTERLTKRNSPPPNDRAQDAVPSNQVGPPASPVRGRRENNYPESIPTSSSSATNTLSARSVPLSAVKLDPGEYKITFFFDSLTIKCKHVDRGDWKLSFYHPPLGVDAEDRCEINMRIKECNVEGDKRRLLFNIEDNEVWKLTIPAITQEILTVPMKLSIRRPPSETKPVSRLFAYLPVGEVFCKQLVNNKAQINEKLKVYYESKTSGKFRIGYMLTSVILEKLEPQPQSSFNLQQQVDSYLFEASAPLKTPAPAPKSSKGTRREQHNDVDEYKLRSEAALQSELKAKGDAYLKMLSQEYKKQKEESEREINRKLSELEALKSTYNSKLHDLRVQEERLRKREQELEETNRKATMDIRIALQDIQMKYKKLEMDKNLQVEALQRRIDTTGNELDVANSKISTLEKKLEAKNEEISSMHAQRLNWPEIETLRRLEGLEHENTQLKKSLETVTQERDRYKLRFESEVQERQKNLMTENENLKKQLRSSVANNKSNSVRSARDSIPGLYNEYFGAPLNIGDWEHPEGHVLQSSQMNRINNLNSGDNVSSRLKIDHHGEEISRLTNLRDYLLGTCAYTPYSSTIKEIENKILRHITLKEESDVPR